MTTRGAAALAGGIAAGICGGAFVAIGTVVTNSGNSGVTTHPLAWLTVVGAILAYMGVTMVAVGAIAIGVRLGMLDRDDQMAIDRFALDDD